MVVICKHCQSNCTKGSYVKCDSCNGVFDFKCAIQLSPKFTKASLETIAGSKGGKGFQCCDCSKNVTKPTAREPSISDLLNMFESGMSKLSDQMSSTNADINGISCKVDQFDGRLTEISDQISREVTSQLMSIKNGLDDCLKQVNDVRVDTSLKIERLQVENNSIRRVLNRGDLVISGLFNDLASDKIYQILMNIAKFYDEELCYNEINNFIWIKNRSSLLVKFNNILKRDALLRKYRKGPKLLLSNIYETDTIRTSNGTNLGGEPNANNSNLPRIESRVYINDHATPVESKIQYLCRKLLKDGHVKSYRISYADDPQIKITKKDGLEKNMNLAELSVFFNLFS